MCDTGDKVLSDDLLLGRLRGLGFPAVQEHFPTLASVLRHIHSRGARDHELPPILLLGQCDVTLAYAAELLASQAMAGGCCAVLRDPVICGWDPDARAALVAASEAVEQQAVGGRRRTGVITCLERMPPECMLLVKRCMSAPTCWWVASTRCSARVLSSSIGGMCMVLRVCPLHAEQLLVTLAGGLGALDVERCMRACPPGDVAAVLGLMLSADGSDRLASDAEAAIRAGLSGGECVTRTREAVSRALRAGVHERRMVYSIFTAVSSVAGGQTALRVCHAHDVNMASFRRGLSVGILFERAILDAIRVDAA